MDDSTKLYNLANCIDERGRNSFSLLLRDDPSTISFYQEQVMSFQPQLLGLRMDIL